MISVYANTYCWVGRCFPILMATSLLLHISLQCPWESPSHEDRTRATVCVLGHNLYRSLEPTVAAVNVADARLQWSTTTIDVIEWPAWACVSTLLTPLPLAVCSVFPKRSPRERYLLSWRGSGNEQRAPSFTKETLQFPTKCERL